MTSTWTLSDDQRTEMHDLYRHLHAHPELSMQEHRTAELIEAALSELEIESLRCGGTGVVGILRNGDGPVIGFRADTDGLPIQEDTGAEYASTDTGALEDGTEVPVMHGCGHDTHITALLTAARALVRMREQWSGTVVLMFQPGEETAAGSRAMVDDGLWDRAPKPEVIYGQHVMPGISGTVRLTAGPVMSYADSWRVTLHGRQSHGSQPENSVDPIVLGAHIVTRLQTVVSREISALQSAVVTVGTFHAGLKENIIPATAEFTLNIRSLDDKVREPVLAAVRRIISAEAAASGAPEPEIEELYRFPHNLNDIDETEALREHMVETLGEDKVITGKPFMGSEDFGTLAESIGVPSVFWFFGGFTEEQMAADDVPVNHSPQFLPVMEPTLSTGYAAVMTAVLSKLSTSS